VDKPKRLLADKAYDADSFRNWLKRQGRHSINRYPTDPVSARSNDLSAPQRHRAHVLQVENWRRIATRYDRHAQNYLSGLALAAIICQWI
jgi:transposase